MLKKRYYSVQDKIVGQTDSSSVRMDYMLDGLGSVAGTVSSAGIVQRSFRYKPYGSTLSSSGSGSQPDLSWVGSSGYFSTGLGHSEFYVRARHYSSLEGRWSSVDPLWPSQPQFGYCDSNPATYIDPSGLQIGFVMKRITIKRSVDLYNVTWPGGPKNPQNYTCIPSCVDSGWASVSGSGCGVLGALWHVDCSGTLTGIFEEYQEHVSPSVWVLSFSLECNSSGSCPDPATNWLATALSGFLNQGSGFPTAAGLWVDAHQCGTIGDARSGPTVLDGLRRCNVSFTPRKPIVRSSYEYHDVWTMTNYYLRCSRFNTDALAPTPTMGVAPPFHAC